MKQSRFYLVGCALVAALGGLLFGFDTAVISGTTDWLKGGFVSEITRQIMPVVPTSWQSWVSEAEVLNFMLGFTVATALIGTVIGSLAIGRPADSIGRRGALVILAVFYVITAVGCGLAWNWWSFAIFRFLGGLAVGGASVVSPMYIAEISPARMRGRLVAITQLNVVSGILLAYLSNYTIGYLAGGTLHDVHYRWMFGVMAFPAIAFFLLLFLTPQSPRWLVGRGLLDEAKRVLMACGTDDGDIDDEIKAIRESLDVEHHRSNERFFCRKYSRPIMLAVAIAAFNQLSGINAVIYYTPHIFKMAGAKTDSALLQSVLIGVMMLVFTFFAMVVIDHFGRRRLMLLGSIGYLLSLGTVTACFYAGGTIGGKWLLLGSLLVYMAAHGFGQGAVIWVFISEIFPNRVRARGQALGSFTHWIMAAAVSWTFPMVAPWVAFAFYTGCMFLQLLWVQFIMPETKGVSLEEIQHRLKIE